MSYADSLSLSLLPRTIYQTQIVDKKGNPRKFTPQKMDPARLEFQKVLEGLSSFISSSTSEEILGLLSRKIVEGDFSDADKTLKRKIKATVFSEISPILKVCHTKNKELRKPYNQHEISSLIYLLSPSLSEPKEIVTLEQPAKVESKEMNYIRSLKTQPANDPKTAEREVKVDDLSASLDSLLACFKDQNKFYFNLLKKCTDYIRENSNTSSKELVSKVLKIHQQLITQSSSLAGDVETLTLLIPLMENLKQKEDLSTCHELVRHYWKTEDNAVRQLVFPIAEELIQVFASGSNAANAVNLSAMLRELSTERRSIGSSTIRALSNLRTPQASDETVFWMLVIVPEIVRSKTIPRNNKKQLLNKYFENLEQAIPQCSVETVKLVVESFDSINQSNEHSRSITLKIVLRLLEFKELQMAMSFVLANSTHLSPQGQQTVFDKLFNALPEIVDEKKLESYFLYVDLEKFLSQFIKPDSPIGMQDRCLTRLLISINRMANNFTEAQTPFLQTSRAHFLKHKGVFQKVGNVGEYFGSYLDCFANSTPPKELDEESKVFCYQLIAENSLPIGNYLLENPSKIRPYNGSMVQYSFKRALADIGNSQAVSDSFAVFLVIMKWTGFKLSERDRNWIKGIGHLNRVLRESDCSLAHKMKWSIAFFELLNIDLNKRRIKELPLDDFAVGYLKKIEILIDLIVEHPDDYQDLIRPIIQVITHLVYEERCPIKVIIRVLVKLIKAIKNNENEQALIAFFTKSNPKSFEGNPKVIWEFIEELVSHPDPSFLSMKVAIGNLQYKKDEAFKDAFDQFMDFYERILKTILGHFSGDNLRFLLDFLLTSLLTPQFREFLNNREIQSNKTKDDLYIGKHLVAESPEEHCLILAFCEKIISSDWDRYETEIAEEKLDLHQIQEKFKGMNSNLYRLSTTWARYRPEIYLSQVERYFSLGEKSFNYMEYDLTKEIEQRLLLLFVGGRLLGPSVFRNPSQLSPSLQMKVSQLFLKWAKMIAPNYSKQIFEHPLKLLFGDQYEQWFKMVFAQNPQTGAEFNDIIDKIMKDLKNR